MSQENALISSHSSDVAPRVPVSFRLPPQIISAVDTYATDNRLSKTDAFVFFVQKGMDATVKDVQDSTLKSIDTRLERIEEMLGAR